MNKKRSPLYVTTLIAGAFFMENLDGTIIATALPQMSRSFHVSAVSLNIGMTAYLLTLAVFIPISGWVADRIGSRTVFATAIGIFTLASLLCGMSHTLTQFTLMRILQGVGGAMMVPVGRLVVLRSTPKDQLAQADDNLRRQVEVAESNYRENLLLARQAPVQSKAARLSYQGLQLSYKSGLVDFTRLTQGQYQLLNAEMAEVDANLQVWRSLLDIGVAKGNLNLFIDQLK